MEQCLVYVWLPLLSQQVDDLQLSCGVAYCRRHKFTSRDCVLDVQYLEVHPLKWDGHWMETDQ
jgi:hypothetical protein